MTVFSWNSKSYDTSYLSTVPYAYLTPTLSGVGNTSPWIFAALEDALAQINLNVVGSAVALVATSTGTATIQTGAQTLNVGPGKSFVAGSFVTIYNTPAPTNYLLTQVTSYDSGTGVMNFNTLNGDTGGSGTYNAWTIVVSGRKGNQGPDGFSYAFDAGTANADPGASRLRFNQPTAPATTAIYVDNVESGGASIASWLATLGSSTNPNKGRLSIRSQTDPTKWVMFTLSAASAQTGYYALTVAIAAYSTASPFADGGAVMMDFDPSGDKGDPGLTGPPGSGSTLNFYNAGSLVSVAPRAALNVTGAASMTDNSGAGRVDVTIHPMNAAGDMVIGGASGVQTRLPAGTNSQLLTLVSGSPAWAAAPAAILPIVTRTSNTILAAADQQKFIDVTSGSFTQTITAAATLGANWFVRYRNSGTGIVTIDPNGAETIDGRTTINVYPGESFIIATDGANFSTIGRKRKGELVLVSETTVSAVAAIDFTTAAAWTDTEFDDFLFRLDDLATASPAEWWARISTSATFQSGTNYNITLINGNNGAAPTGGGGTGQNQFTLTALAGSVLASVNGEIWLYNFRNATRSKNMRSMLGGDRGGPAGFVCHSGGNFNGNTSAWDGFRLLLSSGGNFTAQGTIQWYGRRN